MKLVSKELRRDNDVFIIEITRAEAAVIHSAIGPVSPKDMKVSLGERFESAIEDKEAASHLLNDIYGFCKELVYRNA